MNTLPRTYNGYGTEFTPAGHYSSVLHNSSPFPPHNGKMSQLLSEVILESQDLCNFMSAYILSNTKDTSGSIRLII